MNREKPLISVLDTGYPSYGVEQRLLEREGYNLAIFRGEAEDAEGKTELARTSVGIFVRWTRVDEAFLRQCPRLKAVVRYGAGYENVDLEAARRAGVRVANVGGYGNHSVSDHALALVYACTRGLFRGAAGFSEHFGKPPFTRIFELHRKTLGIIGLGRIGGTLARKALPLFRRVLAVDPYIPGQRFRELGVQPTDLEKLLRESDVISIHCNLTSETTGLLGEKEYGLTERSPVLVNTARGPVLETEALLNALASGRIHSAGLDVFHSEIPDRIDPRLTHHPQIICTGHYAWYSENSQEALQKKAAGNMLSLLAGRETGDRLT